MYKYGMCISITYELGSGGTMILSKDEQSGVYCDNCGLIVKNTLLFSFDNSSNEYGCLTICEHCLTKAKTEFLQETKDTI
jgi:hypothetical protein